MLSLDLMLIILARGALGLSFAGVLGVGSWALIRVSVQTPNSDSPSFFLVHAAMLGVPAAAGAALAWWNTQSSGRVNWLAVVLTLGTALVSTWLVLEIRGVETYNALFFGFLRVPVISTKDMLSKMVFTAVLSANAAAAAFYLYRALRHREV